MNTIPPSESPGGTGVVPPVPPQEPPPAPEEWHPPPAPRQVPLARLVLGAVLLAGGVLWLLGATDVVEISLLSVLAGALIVVGLGLVAASRTGRHSGLIALGIALSLLLAGASTFDVRLSGGIGERTFTPHSVADIHKRYDLAVGQLTIDLREIPVLGAKTPLVEARVGVGQLVVHVPPVVVQARGRAGLGEVMILGRSDDGFGADLSVASPHPMGTGSLGLDLSVGIGQVTVDGG